MNNLESIPHPVVNSDYVLDIDELRSRLRTNMRIYVVTDAQIREGLECYCCGEAFQEGEYVFSKTNISTKYYKLRHALEKLII